MTEIYGRVMHFLTQWQYKLNMMVSSNLRSMDDGSLWGVAAILGIAFVYGVIHAAGPGHGKALVGFYFLKRGGSYARAFRMGYMIAVIHALSALTLTLVLFYVIQTLFSKTFREVSHYSMQLSGALIFLVGFYLVYEAYRHRRAKEKEAHPESRSEFAVALSAGIVPCPGVMTITLFALSLGHIAVGIATALVMSIGMGLTISLAGIVSVGLRKRGGGLLGRYGYLLEFAAAGLVIALWAFLFLGAMGRP
jgi:nickel/cobalt exporter